MDDEYRWDDSTYDAVQAAGLTWPDIIHVLRYARPRIRRHIGSALHVAAPTRTGVWVAVALIEEDEDDHYLIVGVRLLDELETKALKGMTKGGQ